MEHIAIMKKSWKFTGKILSGEKRIESRWYKSKCAPWNRINAGETVYFKDSGEPVTVKARISKVLQFEGLTQRKVKDILDAHAGPCGLEKDDTPKFFKLFKDKKYCMLIFLEDPKSVKPFHIDKNGFGVMSAWISIKDVRHIKVSV